MQKGILIVVSGFSGAGKGTLMKKLMTDYDHYLLSVSMTTRRPRPGEAEGRDYFFVTHGQFTHAIATGGLLEYAEYLGNYYGTPVDNVEKGLASGKDVLLEIETIGAMQVREKYPEALLFFIVPPDIAELRRRLTERDTETEEEIGKRLTKARKESKLLYEYDYVLVNDDLDECARRMDGIITSVHSDIKRNKAFVGRLLTELNAM